MKNSESRIITNKDATDKSRLAYVRCSTIEQNKERQLARMKDLNLYRIYVEKASARDVNRPLLKQLLAYARESYTIFITDFSRLSRNVRDLLTITQDLRNRQIRLVSLTEGLDTQTSTGKLQLNLIGSINQFLRDVYYMYCIDLGGIQWRYATAIEAWNNEVLKVRKSCPPMYLGTAVITGIRTFDDFWQQLDTGAVLQYHAMRVYKVATRESTGSIICLHILM